MRFTEMPYERPDIEAINKEMQSLTEELEAAASYREAKEVFLKEQNSHHHLQENPCYMKQLFYLHYFPLHNM